MYASIASRPSSPELLDVQLGEAGEEVEFLRV